MRVVAVLVHVGVALIRVVLVNLGVCSALTVDVQRLQHVLHVLELFSLQRCVYTIDHVVVSLLLLLFHF